MSDTVTQGDGWNHPEALALVERGREARRRLAVDGDLETYEALTEGHIYFYVDPEEGEQALIRVDQVAVELRWEAPDLVRQRIVGERSETRLPVRDFRYYLDRLTLVQYGFGDEIQVGSGMDVAGVPHPLAPLPDEGPDASPYDFRVVDSLNLRLPGQTEPLRLSEVEVRPRDPSRPGILGSLLLDRATGSIVRMDFGFTPASYVDPRTDRIHVEVDYGLWEGRYWLPNRQEIRVRRELPELDLGVGTVIHAVLRVGDYRFNVTHPYRFEERPAVTWAPASDREDYPFEDGLLEGLDRHGLANLELDADPRELRARAIELLQNRPPSGMASFRLHLPRISSALRYNRTEGLYLGAGGSARPSATLRMRAHGGYAFGLRRAAGALVADGIWGESHGWQVSAGANELLDLGLRPASNPLVSSLAGLVRGEDYMDPFRASRIGAALQGTAGDGWRIRGGGELRRDRSLALAEASAPLADERTFRPVRSVADGLFGSARLEVTRELSWPGGGSGRMQARAQLLGGEEGTGGAVEVEAFARWAAPAGKQELEAELLGRVWTGDPLPQGHRLLGGRGTVPGYPFRAWAGRHLAMGSVEAATDLVGPLVRLRAGLHAGWAGRGSPAVLESWDVDGSDGMRPAATLGLGLGWDLLRVQMARGLRGGEWQLLLYLDPRWWDRL